MEVEEDEGVFEPVARLSKEDTVQDPWMNQELLSMVSRHRSEWINKKLPQFEHVERVVSQMRDLGSFFAVQQHLFHTAKCIADCEEAKRKREEKFSGRRGQTVEESRHQAYTAKQMRKMVMMARAKALGEVYHQDEEESEEDEDEREPEDVPLDEPPPQSNVEETLEDLEEPREGSLSPLLQKKAREWIIPVSFLGKPRHVRVLIFSLVPYLNDVQSGTLFSEKSVPMEIAERLQGVGVHVDEIAAMCCVPFCHAGQWGEYRNVPHTMMRFFTPYARELIVTLKPQYVVVYTKPSSFILQQEMNPEKARPDVITENTLVRVKIAKGFSPEFIRFLHPMEVKNGGALAEEREAGIAKFCRVVSPVKRVRNALDVLMGRTLSDESDTGRLVWSLGGRVGIMAFPREEDVVPMLRQGVVFVLNMTNRKLPGTKKRDFKFVEPQLDANRISMTEVIATFQSMVEAVGVSRRAIICCGTGIRDSVKVFAMLLVYLFPFMSSRRIDQWIAEMRGTRMPLEDSQEVHEFKEFACSMRNYPTNPETSTEPLSVVAYMKKEPKKRRFVCCCGTPFQARLVVEEVEKDPDVLKAEFRDRKKKKEKKMKHYEPKDEVYDSNKKKKVV